MIYINFNENYGLYLHKNILLVLSKTSILKILIHPALKLNIIIL